MRCLGVRLAGDLIGRWTSAVRTLSAIPYCCCSMLIMKPFLLRCRRRGRGNCGSACSIPLTPGHASGVRRWTAVPAAGPRHGRPTDQGAAGRSAITPGNCCRRGKPHCMEASQHRAQRGRIRPQATPSASCGADVLPSGGVHFRVWASRRQHVEVVLEGGPGHHPGAEPISVVLAPAGNGYFSGLVPEASAGTLYRYRLDGVQSPIRMPPHAFSPMVPMVRRK